MATVTAIQSIARSSLSLSSSQIRISANGTATGITGVTSATGTAHPGFGCSSNSFQTIPDPFPACGIQLASNVSTIDILGACCGTAPRVRYNNNCHAYCEARNQTVERLHNCLSDGLSRANGFAGQLPILCNRAGVSYSSLLPANTEDPATRATPGAATAPASNAASGPLLAGRGLSVSEQGVLSFGAWTTVVVLAVSALAGLAA